MTDPGEVTRLLAALRGGDQVAVQQLMPLVMNEMHRLAASYMRRERADHTLQPTALVNEAYLRLLGTGEIAWENRAHFFALAAQAMRRVLVDHARKNAAARRGGDQEKVEINDQLLRTEPNAVEVLAIDQALQRLTALSKLQSKIVELRCFSGMNFDEIAEYLGISQRTVRRHWSVARAWLRAELALEDNDSGTMAASN